MTHDQMIEYERMQQARGNKYLASFTRTNKLTFEQVLPIIKLGGLAMRSCEYAFAVGDLKIRVTCLSDSGWISEGGVDVFLGKSLHIRDLDEFMVSRRLVLIKQELLMDAESYFSASLQKYRYTVHNWTPSHEDILAEDWELSGFYY